MLGQLIIRGTLVAGTLDILSAFFFAGLAGTGPVRVLQTVASGPFGEEAIQAGAGGAALGALVHYALMAVMAAVFVLAASRNPWISRHPVASGLIYGLVLYIVMYWMVLPLRWPTVFPQTGAWDMGQALFSHLICTGLPLSMVTAYGLRQAHGVLAPSAR